MLTVEDGFRLRNIIILGEIWHWILIWTRDHYACLCGEGDFFTLPHTATTHGGNERFSGGLET